MKNLSIQIFNSPQFGEVRVTEIDGKICFAGTDVAKALGYANTGEALSGHCGNVTKRSIPASDGIREIPVISEGDLLRLVTESQLPGSEAFELWIFDEVLPAVCNDAVIRALRIAQDAIDRQTRRIRTLEDQNERLKNKLQKNKSGEQEQRISQTVLFETNFCKFADSYFVPRPENCTDIFSPVDKGYFNTFISKRESFKKFRETIFFKQRKNYTVQKFKQHIEQWCRDRGYQFNPESIITDRANGRIIKRRSNKTEEFIYIGFTKNEHNAK